MLNNFYLNNLFLKNKFFELNQLNFLIDAEKKKYIQAIKENQTLAQVKVIYLTIKELEEKAHKLMEQAADKLK